MRKSYNPIKDEKTALHQLFSVNYFHTLQNQHMLFWFRKDALFAC